MPKGCKAKNQAKFLDYSPSPSLHRRRYSGYEIPHAMPHFFRAANLFANSSTSGIVPPTGPLL